MSLLNEFKFIKNFLGEPFFVRKPNDINVLVNKQTKIECEVSGFPLPNVQWYIKISIQIMINITVETINILPFYLTYLTNHPISIDILSLFYKREAEYIFLLY